MVFGDIGTSPLYAMREALAPRPRTVGAPSWRCWAWSRWCIWALILIVTVKYVIFLMRADNKGEGGTLALMALAQRAVGRRTVLIFVLGMVGAALFYGDGMITPAISVLSAVEGVEDAPGRRPRPRALRPADRRRSSWSACSWSSRAAPSGSPRFFGPITALWFLALGGAGRLPPERRPRRSSARSAPTTASGS